MLFYYIFFLQICKSPDTNSNIIEYNETKNEDEYLLDENTNKSFTNSNIIEYNETKNEDEYLLDKNTSKGFTNSNIIKYNEMNNKDGYLSNENTNKSFTNSNIIKYNEDEYLLDENTNKSFTNSNIIKYNKDEYLLDENTNKSFTNSNIIKYNEMNNEDEYLLDDDAKKDFNLLFDSINVQLDKKTYEDTIECISHVEAIALDQLKIEFRTQDRWKNLFFSILLKNKKYILKQINMDLDNPDYPSEIISKLKHENICKWYCTYKQLINDKNTIFNWILIEYHIGLTKQDFTGNYRMIQKISRDILNALKYLHQNGIAHLDINYHNIMVKKENNKITYKLTGFDLARSILTSQEKITYLHGTLPFISPEIYNKEKFTTKSDIWSFGVTLYYLFSERDSFKLFKTRDYYNKLKSCFIPKRILRFENNVDDELISFICQFLILNEEDRRSAESLLKHEFLSKEY